MAWDLLGRGITLEEPEGNEDKVMTFLGCEHRRAKKEIDTPIAQLKVLSGMFHIPCAGA